MSRQTRWAVAVAVICLAGCAGSLFQSKATPPSIYLLSPAGPAADGDGLAANGPAANGPASDIPVDLAVLKPRVSAGLQSDRIAVLYPDRRLDYFADARWSGPLAEVLQDLAVQEFRTRAALRTVRGEASVFASAYWLEIEVTAFQAEYTAARAAPTVRVHFLARLGGSGDRHILAQFVANAEQRAAENRLGSIVDAFARAADGALSEIVVHADATLAKMSEAR